jgi:hypothetical protein
VITSSEVTNPTVTHASGEKLSMHQSVSWWVALRTLIHSCVASSTVGNTVSLESAGCNFVQQAKSHVLTRTIKSQTQTAPQVTKQQWFKWKACEPEKERQFMQC